MGRERALSFSLIDESQASGILGDVVRESNVWLGGSSIGKGLKKAANYYMKTNLLAQGKPSHLQLPGSTDLNEDVDSMPLEESFYVVDIGVVVSQVYQWRRFFPRVEPYYAVKCNPDPVIIKTLAVLGCNFDCASVNEIKIVHECSQDLPRKPEIIFANPCKARSHVVEAVCKGVRRVTFDNANEIIKCASISKKIELILRIITDDRGSQCRLSSKFGAPEFKWRPLLATAKKYGMSVVGVSFHVGSGCRDASRYEMALKDAKRIFEMSQKEFGMKMTILDIGGGFPGETHSIWNPAAELEDAEEKDVGKKVEDDEEEEGNNRFMFFTEIAEQVAPVIDELFPPESGVKIIGEPGRYFVAASSTLCCSITSCRNNEVDATFEPEEHNDKELSEKLNDMSREEERELIRGRGTSFSEQGDGTNTIMDTIQEELNDYSKLYASQQLAQQEVDLYNDNLDFYDQEIETSFDILGPPEENQRKTRHHTVEGMTYALVAGTEEEKQDTNGLLSLAAAGEAAVNGLMMQAVADSAPLQDDFSYYINDGVYGAFNNIMFDHATCRPRVLNKIKKIIRSETDEDGFQILMEENPPSSGSSGSDEETTQTNNKLYASTVFGPTCDSIDVIARSVLLPKLKIGDWLYFENMGAYTSAAASTFNGFVPSKKFYVCSVQPEYFEAIIAGPKAEDSSDEEKKDDEEPPLNVVEQD